MSLCLTMEKNSSDSSMVLMKKTTKSSLPPTEKYHDVKWKASLVKKIWDASNRLTQSKADVERMKILVHLERCVAIHGVTKSIGRLVMRGPHCLRNAHLLSRVQSICVSR